MTSRRVQTACLLALLFHMGCSADGGPVGSGIASGISGNIVAVESESGANASTEGVRIRVEDGSGLETTSDEDGNFELSGEFSGEVRVRFVTPEYSTEQVLDVPQGSTILMRDLMVRMGMLQMPPPSVLGFFGQVVMVDCSGDSPTLLINDRRPMPTQILVRLDDNTEIVRGDGSPQTCANLEVGKAVAIQGALNLAERTMLAVTITLNPPPPGMASPIRDIRFRGPILVINCPQGQLLLNDEQRTRLRLEPGLTRIHDPQNQPIPCAALRAGDTVAGIGEVSTRRPGVITAKDLVRLEIASQ